MRFLIDKLSMKESSNELKRMREQFNSAVLTCRLSSSTAERYRSWIRRFLIYCRNLGLSITEEAASAFLTAYKSAYTRRQGYFALRFFFVKVLERSFAPEQLQEFVIRQKRRKRKASQRRWLWWR